MWNRLDGRTKRNVILLLLSLLLMVGILAASVLQRNADVKEEQTEREQLTQPEDAVLTAEAVRLFSYFYYDKSEREALLVSDFTGSIYLHALKQGGALLSDSLKSRLAEAERTGQALTYRLLWELLLGMEKQFSVTQALQGLELYGHAEEERVARSDFLRLYLALTEYTNGAVKRRELYVLGEKESLRRDKEPYLVTTEGNYFYKAAAIEQEALIDCCLDVLVSGEELLYVVREQKNAVTIKNVWLIKGEEKEIKIFFAGLEKTFSAKARLKDRTEACVADITVQEGVVLSMRLKPDTISGKVLRTGSDSLELEGYGVLEYGADFRIYKIYGDIQSEVAESILVGYSITEFVLEDGKICAALITETLKADRIRVLIQTDGYGGYYHDGIQISSDSAFTVTKGETVTSYPAGSMFTVHTGEVTEQERLILATEKETGKLMISSVNRSDGNPAVRGTLEISAGEQGLLLINELSLEEYLYAVVPSEMPTYYGSEALKVQAVCARSYAYNQLLANRFRAYGAHVDDSVACQVYNNIAENEASIAAVKATYGQVMRYGDEVATAYYFAASCGHTTNIEDVWQNAKPVGYLTGRLQREGSEEALALTEEADFVEFLLDVETPSYDAASPWYRWTVFLSYEALTKSVNTAIGKRYEAGAEQIKTKTAAGLWESLPVSSVGTVEELQVVSRGNGGIITKLLIKGSKKTVLVEKEYNIRTLLAPKEATILRNDGTEVSYMSLLPSAYFTMQEGEKDGKKGLWFFGGGYGHGVGMSQTGVRAMTEAGYQYEEILKHYYPGITLGFIY